ncbi:MAG: hypothetical protein L3J29_10230 [Cyclobacteriaceae bacterium]|nr:hypothetical protein [Cyclobacteriaceae bacterium]
MRIWFKAILITVSIAAVILFFDAYWFVDKHKEFYKGQEITLANQATPEAEPIKLLKDSLFVSISSENYSNFALRLSSSYAKARQYDSAASYKELIANRFPNEENWKNAGLMYFKAFKNASGEQEEQQMALKAIACLENVEGISSSEKVKLALANLYYSYEEGIKATRLLQEVLIVDTANQEALYSLGIHFFQSNNFEKATAYLSQLIQVDSTHINGMYYLAIADIKIGNTKEGKMLFEKLKLLEIPAEVKANVDDYLNEIK